MPSINALASEKLTDLKARHLLRTFKPVERVDAVTIRRDGRELVSFSCSNYLGLGSHPDVLAAARDALASHGTGAGASRLVTGSYLLYDELERSIAAWKGTESALVLGSGYMVNMGLIPALVGEDDCIIADKLAHACLLDGAKLSGAKLYRFKHNDMADCERLLAAHRKNHKQCLILTEGVFSMDGDIPPLPDLVKLAHAYDANVICDDAHATGVINGGKGTTFKDERLIVVGTLSKALGGYGGYVAGTKLLMEYLVNHMRTLMFSTGLPPASVASANAALRVLQSEPELVTNLHTRVKLFCEALGLPQSLSAIVPIVIGDAEKTVNASKALEEQGFLVIPIRPPTVPAGTSRLRIVLSALHSEKTVLALADALKKII